MDQQEIADARRHLEPERLDLLASARPASSSLWATAVSTCAHRPGSPRRRPRSPAPLTLNGPADAVQRVDDMRRPVAPADAQIGEAVDLREGPRHHDVVAGGDEFEAGRIVVAADIFGVGRVEDEQHVRRQGRMQALHLVERQVGAGRVVGVGEDRRSWCAASPCARIASTSAV